MSAAPRWESADVADLLELVAEGNLASPTPAEEWTEFVAALEAVALINDGLIPPNSLRPEVRGVVSPRRIGAFTHRALSQGLVEYAGTYQISDDTQGKNGGKPCRVLLWLGEAS